MKTKFTEIMFSKNFKALQETFDIGSKADAIANLAKEIIEQADKALALQLENENK